jgi:Uma2 family endonuclease
METISKTLQIPKNHRITLPNRVPIGEAEIGVTRLSKPTAFRAKNERPGWIPADILFDWDTNPYAYQTEEELMPEGGPHGQLSAYIYELLRSYLSEKDLMLLIDTFMLYRDKQGIKQRIAPDLLLMPLNFPAPSSYDMDVEPTPLCLVEITSPNSHKKDLEDNVSLYMDLLEVPTYLVIDAISPKGKLRDPIELHLWRKINKQVQKMAPDRSGYFALPQMGLKVGVQGQKIVFVDKASGEILLDTTALKNALAEEKEQAFSEGEQKGRIEIARAMLADGLDSAIIMKYTGLSPDELAALY